MIRILTIAGCVALAACDINPAYVTRSGADTVSVGYVMSRPNQAHAEANRYCIAKGFKPAVLIHDEISLTLNRDRVATFRCSD